MKNAGALVESNRINDCLSQTSLDSPKATLVKLSTKGMHSVLENMAFWPDCWVGYVSPGRRYLNFFGEQDIQRDGYKEP